MSKKMRKGFTLVEILIVVVILGILAAIVIPQFSDASTQSKVSNLQSSLQTMRSQISLYKIQHNDVAPAVLTFRDQMCTYTDVDGGTSATKDATHIFGPYLREVPMNPFTQGNGVGTGNTNDWNYTVVGGTEATIFAGADTTADTLLHEAY